MIAISSVIRRPFLQSENISRESSLDACLDDPRFTIL